MKFFNYKILSIGLFLFIAVGCEEILDIEPEDRVDLDVLYETPTDAEAGLVGIYFESFRQFLPDMIFNANLSSNDFYDAQRGAANRPVNFRPALRIDNDGGVSTDWRLAYSAIQRANLLIESVSEIPEIQFSEGSTGGVSRRTEIIAEARFMRAWLYYILTMNWGNVPLVTGFPTTSDPGANNVEASSRDEVMVQVNEDLLFAEENLPWNHNNIRDFPVDEEQVGPVLNSKGRPTKGAAKMMLAKIHLMQQEWQQAIDKVDDVINSGEFSMVENWTDIFHNTGGQNTTESIWEVQSEQGEFNNTGGYFFRTESSSRASGRFSSYSLFEGDEADPRDVRQGFSFRPSTNDPVNFITVLKYYNRGGGFGTSDPFNFVLLRLAEAYLIKAEALNEIAYGNQESLDLINAIRTRATGEFDGVVYTGIDSARFEDLTDQQQFRDFVREERARELMYEGHQWYDLLRYDSYDGGTRAVQATSLDLSEEGADPRKILLPIPDREIRVNTSLSQNGGY